MNHPNILKAFKEVHDDFTAMSREEFDTMMKEYPNNESLDLFEEHLRLDQITYEKRIAELEQELDSYKNPVYCPICSSCGESGCCPPDMCRSVQLMQVIDEMTKTWSPTEYPHTRKTLEDLQELFKCGFYCDWNIKSYKDIAKDWNMFMLTDRSSCRTRFIG
jgi:hypothetical protein